MTSNDNPAATDIFDAVVIGAGQAGLATGHHLRKAGQRFVILDAADAPGGSWKHHYRSLRLFSPARYSSLPGMAFPGDPDRYPSRDETMAYLTQYAAEQQVPIQSGSRVNEVRRRAEGVFEVHEGGRVLLARAVIAATGSFERPRMPALPGQDDFRGTLLHSLAYQSPEAFTGQRVVVVGAANSGVQIAAELAGHARVSIAARRPPSLLRQRLLGIDVHAWWSAFGLDTAEVTTWRADIFKRLHSKTGPSVLDAGIYREALASGHPDIRPMLQQFTPEGVVWADGTAEPVDAVIFATGFLPNLDYLAPLDAFDRHGAPRQKRGISTAVPGLYYVGLSYQRTYASATLRGVGPDARVVVDHLAEHLRGQKPSAEEAAPVGPRIEPVQLPA
ncbi:MAG: hypothetical protein RLZZ618_1726 [Pseudomonadota bacterium]|jgi:putative flavoprotein involved in K+ transport